MTSPILLLALIALASQLPAMESANILGVFTAHSPSHLIVHMSLAKALAEQGHNVTVVSTLQPVITHPNIKNIVIPLSAEEEQQLNDGMSMMAKQKPSLWTTMKSIFTSLIMLIDKQVDALEDPRFTELYKNGDNKFDLVIVGFFFNNYQVGLGAKFNCPIIVNWSGPPMEMLDQMVGNPRLVSIVPNTNMAVQSGVPMTFVQRIQNYLTTCGFRVLSTVLDTKFKGFYKRLFDDDKNMPSFGEAKKNVSLVFCNSHSLSEGPVRPNVPGIVEIGGIQIKDKPEPLPEDIEEFLAKAKHGAILFSLGSNLKGEHIQSETITQIFEALSSLKQHVIWKWENLKKTPGQSPNILYKKWLPQDDILAHPKIKLFITHAGKGGLAEAQYHGVPMLAMPVFADQPGNADKMVDAGYGLRINLLSLESGELKSSIKEILKNTSYAERVQKFSKLYRDRPMTPRQSAIYWTNYILRHHGAVHMQSPLVHMGFVASNNFDVYALLIAILILAVQITKVVMKFLFRKCCGGKSKKDAQKKKVKKQ